MDNLKSYLFVYNEAFGSKEDVINILDRIIEITNWRSDLPHSFYLRTASPTLYIAQKIKKLALSKNCNFILTEIADDSEGYIPLSSWYFIKGESDEEDVEQVEDSSTS